MFGNQIRVSLRILQGVHNRRARGTFNSRRANLEFDFRALFSITSRARWKSLQCVDDPRSRCGQSHPSGTSSAGRLNASQRRSLPDLDVLELRGPHSLVSGAVGQILKSTQVGTQVSNEFCKVRTIATRAEPCEKHVRKSSSRVAANFARRAQSQSARDLQFPPREVGIGV